jgi:hypothetical protein
MVTLLQVQPNVGNSGGASTAALAFGSNTTAHSLQVALIQVFPQAEILSSITDTQLNLWNIIAAQPVPTNYDLYFCYALNTLGGANTVTAHFSGATTNVAFCMAEFAGVNALRVADAGNTGLNTTAVSSAAIAAIAGDLLIGYAGLGSQAATQASAPGGGFVNTTVGQIAATGFIEFMMHNLSAAGGSVTATSTINNSQNFSAGLVAFFQSGGATGNQSWLSLGQRASLRGAFRHRKKSI